MHKETTSQSKASAPLSPNVAPNDPNFDSQERLPVLLKGILTGAESGVSVALSPTQLHFLKSWFLPSVPDSSDTRSTQFQHRANGCTAIAKTLAQLGYTRDDIRLGLEQVRYLQFVEDVDRWINTARTSPSSPPPGALNFDVRDRAHARTAFEPVARHLRIPPHLLDHGTLIPFFRSGLGFGFRVVQESSTSTFLSALANGKRLAPLSADTQANARGLTSPNRQLLNLLHAQAPVNLDQALAPRAVHDVGTPRISLFCRGDEKSPHNYLYLPPSVKESALIPEVDGAALCRGVRLIRLTGKDSRKLVATVTIPDQLNPTPIIALHKDVEPSPFRRFRPWAAYLRANTNEAPEPFEIEIHRRELGTYAHQRVLFGDQMTVPTWYPLRSITLHALSTPTHERYIGLYPPGVSPRTTPPLKAFILDPKVAAFQPAVVKDLWTGPVNERKEVLSLAEDVVGAETSASRDAWLALHHKAQTDPLLIHSLLCAAHHPFSLVAKAAVIKLTALPGWNVFQARLEDSVRTHQARSVPFVAQLLADAISRYGSGVHQILNYMSDNLSAPPNDPPAVLTRLAVTAKQELERTFEVIRQSPVEGFSLLAGPVGSLTQYLTQLSRNYTPRIRAGFSPLD